MPVTSLYNRSTASHVQLYLCTGSPSPAHGVAKQQQGQGSAARRAAGEEVPAQRSKVCEGTARHFKLVIVESLVAIVWSTLLATRVCTAPEGEERGSP